MKNFSIIFIWVNVKKKSLTSWFKMLDHEKLIVYQKSIEFVAWTDDLLKEVPKNKAVYNQLERASTSIVLNIAEGNGKFQAADRCRFFDISRGSSLESSACLDVIVAKSITAGNRVTAGKDMLCEIICMLVGLIKANSTRKF